MAASNQRATLLPHADATSAGPVNTHVNDGVQINNNISAGTGNTQYNALNQYFQANADLDQDQLDAQFRRALCSVCPQIDRTDLIDTKGEAVHGTREWVLETKEYQAWLHDDSSLLLWIWGGPGKGKTMLSIFLSQELERENKTLYFFCKAQDEKRSTAVGVLRGLLWQLTSVHPELTKVLREDLDSTAESAFSSRDTLWEAFGKLIRENDSERLYCIIDGLDECDKSSQQWLARKFESLTLSVTKRLKLIMVSRELSGFKHPIQLRLDSDYCEQVKSSVEAFVDNRVNTILERFDGNEILSQEVKDKLSIRAQGTYLYVGFVAIELSRQTTVNGILSTLEELPTGLSPLYSRLLRDIEPSQQRLISHILGFVSLARRPLSLGELASATGCEPVNGALDPKENIRDLVKGFGPLFRISDNGQLIRCDSCRHCFQMPTESDETYCPMCKSSGNFVYEYERNMNSKPLRMSRLKQTPPPRVDTVDLVHESVRDFLRDAKFQDEARFMPDEVHFQLARACIEALVSSKASESGFASYAADFWPFHARHSGVHAKELLSHHSSFFDKDSALRTAWWLRTRHSGDLPRLHMACLLGYTAWVESLLNSWEAKFTNVLLLMQKDSNGATPLHAAVEGGDQKTVSMLLQHASITKAFIDTKYGDDTALYMAASRGHREIAQLLIRHKANVNAKCSKGRTSLHIAAAHGYADVTELLLLHKANVHAQVEISGTALHFGVRSGSVEVVAILLRHGADINAKAHHGSGLRALHLAAAGGGEAMARLLWEHKADLYLEAHDDGTALHIAGRLGDEAVLRLFLGKMDINVMFVRDTAISLAATKGHTSIVQLLLEHGANVGTALHGAASMGHTDIVQLLLEHGAGVGTALHDGAWSGQIGVVKLLLEHGADVGTALHRAASGGHVDVVKLLLEHGANVDATTDGGHTALHKAAEYREPATMEVLLQHSADVNARTLCGDTPLSVAVAQLLISRLDSPLSLTNYGRTIRILLEHGAEFDADIVGMGSRS